MYSFVADGRDPRDVAKEKYDKVVALAGELLVSGSEVSLKKLAAVLPLGEIN
jgi:hypothetical protein